LGKFQENAGKESILSVAVLWDRFGAGQLQAIREIAHSLQIQVDLIKVQKMDEIEEAFDLANTRNAAVVLMTFSPISGVNRSDIASIAIERNMPTMSTVQLMAYSGLLLAGLRVQWRR
jgi:PP-loop superfamily ATP-utilizing enzyme